MDKVFFIDDDPLVLRSFSRSLGKKSTPYEFFFYSNCEEALAALARIEPVCCIVDKRLPGMGGEEFFREVGERYSDIYRILVSADQPTQESLTVCDLYLEKPVTSSSLINSFDKLRDRP